MDNAMKILVATDNHLGYLEKDPIRGDDSFIVFREILQQAHNLQVDLILLGGDLFHDNKPSRKTLYRTMELFREFCFGDRPCSIEFLSDPSINFTEKFSSVNYQDGNFNISYPVFTVHGNHDDPAGEGNYSAVDLLSISGMVNFFGKIKDVDDIAVQPVLLSKGSTKVALYGIGSIRDERMYRSFQRKKVRMFRPTEETENWFNILVIHQNRISHGPTNYIPESFLDSFFEFVIWGHEHECLIEPQVNPLKNFAVCQPGSSIATSLSEGECRQKHIALLTISGPKKFTLEPIPLRHVRPFLLRDISLRNLPGLRQNDAKQLNKVLIQEVNEMLNELKSSNISSLDVDLTSENENPIDIGMQQIFQKPLVRLRVDYSGGYMSLHPQRFGHQFVDLVANPKDILLFYKKRSIKPTFRGGQSVSDNAEDIAEVVSLVAVEDLVQTMLHAQTLGILPQAELREAIRLFIDKDDRDALSSFVEKSIKKTMHFVKETQSLQALCLSGSNNSFQIDDDIHNLIGRSKQEQELDYLSNTGLGGKATLSSEKVNTVSLSKENLNTLHPAVSGLPITDEPEEIDTVRFASDSENENLVNPSVTPRNSENGKANSPFANVKCSHLQENNNIHNNLTPTENSSLSCQLNKRGRSVRGKGPKNTFGYPKSIKDSSTLSQSKSFMGMLSGHSKSTSSAATLFSSEDDNGLDL